MARATSRFRDVLVPSMVATHPNLEYVDVSVSDLGAHDPRYAVDCMRLMVTLPNSTSFRL